MFVKTLVSRDNVNIMSSSRARIVPRDSSNFHRLHRYIYITMASLCCTYQWTPNNLYMKIVMA